MRTQIWFVLGAVMVGLGLYVAMRPLWAHGATVTQSRLLDVGFALLFLVRGWLNVRRAMRMWRAERTVP